MKKIHQLLQKMKNHKYLTCLCSLSALTVLLNLIAFSTSFCNFYTDTAYAFFSDFWGTLTNFLPFSLGEILMYTFALAIFCALLFCMFLLLYKIKAVKNQNTAFKSKDDKKRNTAFKSKADKKWNTTGISRKFLCISKTYFKTLLLTCAFLLFIYTLHWIIPFRSSLLGETGHFEKEFSTEDLRKLWKYSVENLNEICTQVPRDKNGHIIFTSKKETEEKVAEAMKKLSGRYQRLKGHYPSMKAALCSDVLHWMDIGGYTYPYTMEITYNKYITDLYFPSLYAHESAHHQGYYQENEANFLSFLSCMKSDDPVLRYSAFHTIYFYINDAYASALAGEMKRNTPESRHLIKEYLNTKLSEQIALDEAEEKRKVEKSYSSTSHPLQKYSETAQTAADIGWSTQSDVLQENGYDGVVQLLLEYFYG